MFGIYLYSLLMYPLLMQMFEDQYISLTSNWVQLLINGVIFLNTNILFRRKKNSEGLVFMSRTGGIIDER